MNTSKISRTPVNRFALAATVAIFAATLGGCVLAPLAAVGAAATGGATGVGTADDAKLVAITARNFGVSDSQVKVSEVKKENSLFSGSKIYYQAEVKTSGQTKVLNCMITSGLLSGGDSSPLCAKPGESMTGGGGDSCNALTRAAGRC